MTNGETDRSAELRRQLLSDQVVQMILGGLVEGSVSSIEPVFDSERTPRYLIVENIAKTDASEAKNLLEKLTEAQILHEAFYERALFCPRCKSPAGIFVHLKCPKCGTMEIDRVEMWEHPKCGSVWETKTNPEETNCPKCQTNVITESDGFQILGINWSCSKCSSRFDRPDQTFFCRNCNGESHLADIRMNDVKSYSINIETRQEVQDALVLPILKKTFEGLGYHVEMPGSLVGGSGVPHDFTVVAKHEERWLAADLIQTQGTVDVGDVLASSAKLSDVKTEAGLLLAIPSISDKAKAFLTARKVALIEGGDIKQIAAGLQDFLNNGRGRS